MLINLRNALMAGKRLPYDAEVEYLESSGTQWIQTNYVPSNVDVIISRFLAQGTSTDYGLFISRYGTWNANPNYYLLLRFSAADVQLWSFMPYVNLLKYSKIENIQTDLRLDLSAKTITLQNDQLNHFSNIRVGTAHEEQPPLRLFGTIQQIKLYSFAVERNGAKILDLIPVRKGTVGYLYDRVSGKLFGNAGTGDFVLGPDVVPVEYIESHGTEWIDTGYIPDQQTRWELDYQFSTVGIGLNGMFQENPTVRYNLGQVANGLFNISYGANNDLNIAGDTLRHLFVLDAPNLQWRLDSSSGTFPVTVSTTLQNSLCIFCRNSTGGRTYNLHSGRCFASRMYQSGILFQSLLPVRVGTEGAIMDVLTRRIYRNQGTGAFTYGNDLKYPIPAE